MHSVASSGAPARGARDKSAQGAKQVTIASRLLDALFAGHASLCEHANVYWPLLCTLWLYDALQLIVSIPVTTMGDNPAMQGLLQVLHPIVLLPGMSLFGEGANAKADTLFAAFAAILAISFFLMAWVVYDEYRATGYSPQWRLKVLRVVWRFALQAFAVPIMATLLSPFNCASAPNSLWIDTTVQCWQSTHLGYIAGSIILLLLYIPTAVFLLATFISRTPNYSGKRNVYSAPCGRIEAANGVLKMFAAAWFVFGNAQSAVAMQPVFYIAGAGFIGVAWLFLYLRYLPFHHQWANQLQCGFAGVYIAATVCSAFDLASTSSTTSTAAIAFFFVFPLAFYTGQSCAGMRWKQISETAATAGFTLTSPFAIELRVRALVKAARDAAKSHRSSLDAEHGGDSYGGSNGSRALNSSQQSLAQYEHHNNGDGEGAGGGHNKNTAASARRIEVVKRTRRSDSDADVFQLEEFQSHPAAIAAEELINNSVTVSGTPFMRLFAAEYQGQVKGNRHLERLHLRAASVLSDASYADVQFVVRSSIQKLDSEDLDAPAENTGRTTGSKMTVLKRMRYEDLLTQVRVRVASARNSVLAFWTTLSERQPDLTKLQHVGLKINNTLQQTGDDFNELLTLAPQSITAMRLYAEFLLDLANDPHKAHSLLEDAEQLEEEQSRQNVLTDTDVTLGKQSSIDVSNENVALMQVSALPATLGTILSANAAMLKLFGYNRREFVGRDVNILVPEPVATTHASLMGAWVASGQGRFINSGGRLLMAMHHAGHLVTMRINVTSGSETFAVIAEEINTFTQILFFTGKDTNWKLTAACKHSVAMLNLDLSSLKLGNTSAATFIPNVAEVVESLDNTEAKEFVVTLPAASSNATGRGRALSNAREEAEQALQQQQLVKKGSAGGSTFRRNSFMQLRAAPSAGARAPAASTATPAAAAPASASAADASSTHNGGSSSSSSEAEQWMCTGRLQIVAVPGISTPLYVLRWHPQHKIERSASSSTSSAAGGEASVGAARPNPVKRPAGSKASSSDASEGGNSVEVGGGSRGSGDNDDDDDVLRALVEQVDGIPRKRGTAAPTSAAAAAAKPAGGSGSGSKGVARGPQSDGSFHKLLALAAAGKKGNSGGEGGVSPGGGILRNAGQQGQQQQQPRSPDLLRLPGAVNGAAALAGGSSEPNNPALTSDGQWDNVHGGGDAGGEATPGAKKRRSAVGWADGSGVATPGGSEAGSAVIFESGGGSQILGGRRVDFAGGATGDDRSPGGGGGGSGGILRKPLLRQQQQAGGAGSPSGSSRQLGGGDLHYTGGEGGDGGSYHDIPSKAAGGEGGASSSSSGNNNGLLAKKASKAGSVGSRGSGKSGASSVASMSEILRRGVAARGNQLEGSLVLLKRAVLIVSVLIGLMNITSLVVTHVLFSETLININNVIENGDRAVYMNRIFGQFSSINDYTDGLYDINISATHTQVLNWISYYEQLHRDLYQKFDASDPQQYSLYLDPLIVVQDLIPNMWFSPSNYIAGTRNISLMNAGIEYATKARLGLDVVLQNETYSDPNFFWILNNGLISIISAMKSATTLADQSSAIHSDIINLAMLVILAAAESLILLLVVLVLVPAVENVLRNKHIVYSTFLEVPVQVVRSLRDITSKKIEAERRAAEDDDFADADGLILDLSDRVHHGLDDDDDGGGPAAVVDEEQAGLNDLEEAQIALDRTLSSIKDSNRKAFANRQQEEDDDDDIEGCCSSLQLWVRRFMRKRRHARIAAANKDRKVHRARHYRRTKSSRLSLFVQLLWPLAVFAGYFVGIYMFTSNMVVTTNSIRAENLAVKKTQTLTGTITYTSRKMYRYCDMPFLKELTNLFWSASAEIEMLHDSLMYGNADMGIRAGMQVFPEIASIATVNGCIENGGAYYQVADCLAWHNGLAAHGLQGLFKEWLNVARAAVTDRASDIANPPQCTVENIRAPNFAFLFEARWYYIAAAYYAINTVHVADATSTINNFNSVNMVICISAIIALPIMYFAIYLPLIRLLDKEIKDTRRLLLLFPDEVSRTVKTIMDLGQDLVKDAEGAAAST